MRREQLNWDSGAQAALLRSGAIRPCGEHFDVFLRTHDNEGERGAYAVGTSMLKTGKVVDGPRSEFMDHINDVLSRTLDSCFICDAANQIRD